MHACMHACSSLCICSNLFLCVCMCVQHRQFNLVSITNVFDLLSLLLLLVALAAMSRGAFRNIFYSRKLISPLERLLNLISPFISNPFTVSVFSKPEQEAEKGKRLLCESQLVAALPAEGEPKAKRGRRRRQMEHQTELEAATYHLKLENQQLHSGVIILENDLLKPFLFLRLLNIFGLHFSLFYMGISSPTLTILFPLWEEV